MAVHSVKIASKETVGPGRVSVVYYDPGIPGVRYVVEAPGASDPDVANAIAAHIGVRRAAGLDYPKKPAADDQGMDVITP